jgi:hypothetical protein
MASKFAATHCILTLGAMQYRQPAAVVSSAEPEIGFDSDRFSG